ncbi:hypothetical protein DPMN_128002 [Dreissena polymorpha]|uniref:Uncharacterized protein n=1 Tax=Dreissena polymorpha TaxID=45954 RepID=A0A9D4H324_DREPO|nr:hypothetical protein DPMN_128002 [Dreissena polymorpha]
MVLRSASTWEWSTTPCFCTLLALTKLLSTASLYTTVQKSSDGCLHARFRA